MKFQKKMGNLLLDPEEMDDLIVKWQRACLNCVVVYGKLELVTSKFSCLAANVLKQSRDVA